MRIAQVVWPDASEYERKCQRADFAALSASHEVVVAPIGEVRADVAHVYAGRELPRGPFVGFAVPYVSSADVKQARWPLRKAAVPDYVVSPLIEKIEQSRYQPLPEPVEDAYFDAQRSGGLQPADARLKPGATLVVASFARPAVANIIDQTLARIHRFREDVTWNVYTHVPTPADLAGVDVWVDPAAGESDFDGFVAEALVVGAAVVATRTKINVLRLEHGRTGLLVPPRDPNELTHAILAALFKPEVAGAKSAAARQTNSKFRAKQRLRVLVHMYETIIP
ncbi:MAG TPA: glycosyltransferase [Thermoanaerobaculia bacterium]|nr:glycosyltransferase [Thermoanaerobaculia bacterium]